MPFLHQGSYTPEGHHIISRKNGRKASIGRYMLSARLIRRSKRVFPINDPRFGKAAMAKSLEESYGAESAKLPCVRGPVM